MPQSKLVPILAAVRSLFTRFYGTVPNLTDLSSIVLMSQELHGYTHQMILDLTRSDGYAWITDEHRGRGIVWDGKTGDGTLCDL